VPQRVTSVGLDTTEKAGSMARVSDTMQDKRRGFAASVQSTFIRLAARRPTTPRFLPWSVGDRPVTTIYYGSLGSSSQQTRRKMAVTPGYERDSSVIAPWKNAGKTSCATRQDTRRETRILLERDCARLS